MTRDRAHRTWCAIFQWPNKKPFYVGTASVRVDAQQFEVEEELRRLLRDIVPVSEPPELVRLMPGALVFHPEAEEVAAQ